MKQCCPNEHVPRRTLLPWFLALAVCGVATGRAYAQPNVVLVNGSFNIPPVAWMSPGDPEYDTIAATYVALPLQSYWFPDFLVWPPNYTDIFSGPSPLAGFLSSVPPGDLNLVAHSHGGNVAIMSTYLMYRRLRHLINLATPINWDLPGVLGGAGADSRCQISSTADWVQFIGASPYQVLNFAYAIYQSIVGAIEAFEALLAGDYAAAYAYFSQSVFDVLDATYWWLTTKVEVEGPTYMFTGLGHSDLHTPPVWNAIRNYCATN